MKQKLRYLLSLLLTVVCAGYFANAEATEVTWTASSQGYSNSQTITTATINDKVKVTFDKGTSNTVPAYYTTGYAVRIYGGGYFTVTGEPNVTITQIKLTFGSGDKTNEITSDSGTYHNDTGIWNGSERDVTFTVDGTSGHRRIASITITYTTSGGNDKNPANLKFNNSQNYNLQMEVGDEIDDVSFTKDTDAEVEFSFNTENVAEYAYDATNGTVTITALAAGTTVLTASADENDTYAAGTATLTITVNKKDAGLAYNPTSITLTEGDPFTPPTLSNQHDLTVTYVSYNPSVATVSESGFVELAGGTGTTTITASFEGDNTYNAGSASCTIQVNAAASIETYTKVTSDDELEDGDYLIVYENGPYIFDGSRESLDAASNYQSVTISDGVIETSSTYQFTIDKTAGTIQSASGYYIGQTSDANGLNSSPTTEYPNTISLDSDGNAVIVAEGGAFLRFNKNSDQTRFRYFKSSTYTSQQPIALYKKGTPVPSLSFAEAEVTTDFITNGTYTQAVVYKYMGSPDITYLIESLDVGIDVENIATINSGTGEVSFVDPGDVKITATTTYNEQNYTAYYTLHIVEPTIELFELVTSQDEIVDGGEYLIVEKTLQTSAQAYNGQDGTHHYADEVTVEINGIEINNATPQAHVIELEATNDGHWYLKDQTDSRYLTSGTTNGYLYFDDSPTDASKWDINVELVNTTIVNTSDRTFQIKYNGTESYNGTNFSSYTGIFTYIQLYKRATALADGGIYYNDPTSYNVNLGESFTAPMLQNPNRLSPITYSSSNPSAIAVNATTGAVTVKRSGSAVITATFKGNAAYKKSVATYNLYVSKVKNEGLLFNETFDKLWANGGNDALFSGSVAKPYNRASGWAGQQPDETDNNWDKSWTTDEIWDMFDTDEERDPTSNVNSYVQAGNQCAKFGAGSPTNNNQTNGVLTTRAISMGEGVTQGTLTFSAAGWGTGDNTLTVSATGCTITYFSHTGNSSVSGNAISLENGVWNDFVFHITDVTEDITITFKGWRGFIDEIAVGGPYSVTIGSTGYATLYYGSAPLVIPEEVTAYTLQYEEQNGYKDVKKGVELPAGTKLAAGTAVVLRGEPGTYNFPFAFEQVEVKDPDNVLKGSDTATLFDDPAYEYFILGNLDGEIGFYHQAPSGGKYVNNGAHKAFLQIPVGESILNDKGANVKGLRLSLDDLDEPTCIKDIDMTESLFEKNVYYNLSGQRVSRPVRGIYIINGKKVFFK